VVIALDFDGTIVEQDSRAYDDLVTPLVFKPDAQRAVISLARAGHTLILWSARASLALLEDPELDPLVRAGVRVCDRARWERMQPIHIARYLQMLEFIARELPGVFAVVDDGRAGKPLGVDMFIDDKALRLGLGLAGFSWAEIEVMFGEPVYGEAA
jgi:hypothetical protein